MTPEEVRQLSDSDLTRFVAEKVMGWGNLTHYPEYKLGSTTYMVHKELWNPLTDANHRDMVVERMREKGWRVNLCFGPIEEECSAHFKRPGPIVISAVSLNTGRAVLEAALMAVEGQT